MKKIYFATGNEDKLREVRAILADKFQIHCLNVDLPEIQSLDPREIAEFKAKTAFEKFNFPVLVEDTSLFIEDWKGLPGPFIKWFLKTMGIEGIIKMVNNFNSRRAYATVVFVYCNKNGIQTFSGSLNGRIADKPRGKRNSGWDPIFIPDGYSKTLAEMTFEEKNKISHRQNALKKLLKNLKIT